MKTAAWIRASSVHAILGTVMLFAACQSVTRPRAEPVRLTGVITKIDQLEQTIGLGSSSRDRAAAPQTLHYNSLTGVDLGFGTGRVEELRPGDEVIIIGRRELDGDRLVAEQIVVVQPRAR